MLLPTPIQACSNLGLNVLAEPDGTNVLRTAIMGLDSARDVDDTAMKVYRRRIWTAAVGDGTAGGSQA